MNDRFPLDFTIYALTYNKYNNYNTSLNNFTIPNLKAGKLETLVITFEPPVTSTDTKSTSACSRATNTAKLVSLDQIDSNKLNNTASASVVIGKCAVVRPI